MTRHLVIAILLAATSVATAEPNKEECLDAHSRGQDAKEQGKLTLARKLFLSCAQSACPQLVASDCARFADDLQRLQPTVMFAARDASGADLPDTTVYVDDMLVVTRLDDGRPHDIDPGKHNVRFSNGGHDQTVTVVIGAGEQGRTVVATFGGASPHVQASQPVATKAADSAKARAEPQTTHPKAAAALFIGGVTIAVAGGAFGAIELMHVPDGCSLSTHQCAAAPGDPVFADAQRAVHDANLGWTAAGIGLAAAIGGAIWWVEGASKPDGKEHFAIAPWASPTGGGIAISGGL
jgi:hypothetical protein